MADWKKLPDVAPSPSWKELPDVEPQENIPPGSPLEQALAEQTGDIVTVQTPTGPAKFTRQGQRFYDSTEAQGFLDSGMARVKERGLEEALTFFGSGGKFMDEARGADAAVAAAVRGRSPGDAYRQVRNETRRDVQRAESKSPTVEVGGLPLKPVALAGAAAPSMAAGVPSSWLARILASGGAAAVDEAGASTADLTEGEGEQFARDVGGAAGMGLAAGGAAEGLTAPLRYVGARAGREAVAAKQALTDATQAAKDKAARSALGSLGGVVSAQGNAAETISDVLRNPHLYPQNVVNAANTFVQSPEGKMLFGRAATNNLERMPGLLGREEEARRVLMEATQAASPGAVASEVAQKTAPDAILGDLGRKASRSLGQRAALAAGGAALGSGASWLTGVDPEKGGAFGALAGYGAPGVLSFARNQANNPALQFGANALVEKLIGGAAGGFSKAARVMEPTAKSAARNEVTREEEDAIQAFLSGG